MILNLIPIESRIKAEDFEKKFQAYIMIIKNETSIQALVPGKSILLLSKNVKMLLHVVFKCKMKINVASCHHNVKLKKSNNCLN